MTGITMRMMMTMVKSLVQRAELCMSVVDVGPRTARVMLSFDNQVIGGVCLVVGTKVTQNV